MVVHNEQPHLKGACCINMQFLISRAMDIQNMCKAIKVNRRPSVYKELVKSEDSKSVFVLHSMAMALLLVCIIVIFYRVMILTLQVCEVSTFEFWSFLRENRLEH